MKLRWTGIWIFVVAAISAGAASEDEKRLLTDLFKNYNRLEMPVKNVNDTVKVKHGVAIIRIIDVDERQGLIDTSVWLRFVWNDANLKWDKSAYGGVNLLRVFVDQIWMPDIEMYNSEHLNFAPTKIDHIKALVYPSGEVLYVPPVMFRTVCNMDFSRYPLDEHKCMLKFGSWTHDGFKVSLAHYNNETKADTSDYVNSTEWDLIEIPSTHHQKFYNCCPEPYEDITYMMHIRRKGDYLYFAAKMINLFICFLIFMSFILSPESGQKFLTGLASVVINLWIIASANSVLPFNHNCFMAQYFDKLAIFGSVSVFVNLFVIHIHFRTQPMPRMMRNLMLNLLSSKFCIICPAPHKKFITTEMDTFQNYSYSENPDVSVSTGNNMDTQTLITEIKNLKRQITTQNIIADAADDWKYLAIIVNRFLLTFFSIVLVLFVTINFPSLE